jgi:hypothetical protein
MIVIIIFIVAILGAFLMVSYKAWTLRSLPASEIGNTIDYSETFSFRNIEKVVLYWAKHVAVGLVLVVVKYSFTFITKARKWLSEHRPKHAAEIAGLQIAKPYSFMRRTIIEAKIKIKRVKEKIRREHE